MNLPDLGVGISFFLELEPYLKFDDDLINVLLIEPQTFWSHTSSKEQPYKINNDALKFIRNLPYYKIVHSVANPVGGSLLPYVSQIPPLIKMINDLDAVWASEHLSFNRVFNSDGEFNTGFLLPPRQTLEGVHCAVKSIRSFCRNISIPFAIETGVNYLKPRSDEISDGEFVSRIVKLANCGIILDLHNIWTNQLNGREKVEEFLKRIPLDRVWEIHLAGGEEEDGFWLDAHSGSIPQPLLELSETIIPKLPNLHAIIFEIFPSYLPSINSKDISIELQKINKLWNMRGKFKYVPIKSSGNYDLQNDVQYFNDISPMKWEITLGKLVLGREIEEKLSPDLSLDPAIKIYQNLINSFRASNIIRSFRLTSRLIMLHSKKTFRDLLFNYCKAFPPQLFASDEGKGFSKYLEEKNLRIPYLKEVLTFERSLLKSALEESKEVVWFEYDPSVILDAIQEREIPKSPKKGKFKVEIESHVVTYSEYGNK
jgi:uncharacterized protein